MKYIILILLILILLIYKKQTREGYNNTQNIKVGIVSMIKNPHHIVTWINHHLRIGIDKIYIYIDDPNDSAINIIDNYSVVNKKIKMTIMDDKWLTDNNYKTDNNKDEPLNWNVRQDKCVDNALELAKTDNIDILIHIDCDELLYSQSNKKLQDVFNISNKNTFKIKNYEIAPDRDNYENCFVENKFFRKNGDNYIAYGNGKGAGRVGKVKSNGPHEMTEINSSTKHFEINEKDLVVLHYVSCNLEEMIKKYKLYSNFSKKNWEWAKLHLESRDKLSQCSDDCIIKAKELFKKRMKNDKDDIVEINIYK
jgi:hypothetical protein